MLCFSAMFESVCCVSVLCLSLCLLCLSAVVGEGMVCLSLCVVFQSCV